MAHTITMYSGFSKRHNSTKTPSGGTDVNVLLKNPCSIMNPSFTISGFNTSWNYVKWGSRFYYVNDIVIEHNDIATYKCSIDVMATFKSDILASSQMVSRNANTYQPLLADKAYPALNGVVMEDTLISTWDSPINSTGTYVVGVVNPEATGGVQYCTFGAGGNRFALFMQYLFGESWLDGNLADIPVSIQKELINPFQYIVSCQWFPLIIAGTDGLVKFGYWTSDIGTGKLSESQRVVTLEATATLPRHPQQLTNGLAMNGAPYSEYMLDCWCFGQIPLDPQAFVQNNAIGLRVVVDVFTGLATLTVTNAQGKKVAKVSNQFGVPIQLSQITQSVVNPVASALQSGLSLVGGLVSGNVVGGIMGATSGVISAIDTAFPQMQTSGAVGSKIAYQATPSITAKFYRTPTIAPDIVGRPLMEQRTLSTLSGFTKCENVSLNTEASPEEKDVIVDYMTNGFYIE